MSGAFLRVKFAIIMADTVDILTRWFSSSLPPLPSHPPPWRVSLSVVTYLIHSKIKYSSPRNQKLTTALRIGTDAPSDVGSAKLKRR